MDLDRELPESGSQETRMKDFHDMVAQKVQELLNQNIESLFQLLYRIDVSKSAVRAILAGDSVAQAPEIADLIIQRQLQKLETRSRYRNSDLNAR